MWIESHLIKIHFISSLPLYYFSVEIQWFIAKIYKTHSETDAVIKSVYWRQPWISIHDNNIEFFKLSFLVNFFYAYVYDSVSNSK